MKRPERATAQKIAKFHRGHDNQGLKQRIIDEGAGHRQRLVKPEEKSQTHSRKKLKPINRQDADKDSKEDGGGCAAGIKTLLQQSGCKLPHARLETPDHPVAFAIARMVLGLHIKGLHGNGSPIRPIPPTTRRSQPSPHPPRPCRRCTPSAQPRSSFSFQCAVPAPESRA